MGSLALTQRSGVSLGAVGKRKLRSLASALDLSEELTARALEIFTLMSGAWGEWAMGDSPLWPNDISDDGTPFEFSASFDGSRPRLRMLVESQSERISRVSSWAAGVALGERLKAEGLADLSLFDRIQDLFAPHAGVQGGRFSLWHAAVIEEGKPALFKAYVNPSLFGVGSAPYVVEQALKRLGFFDAWKFLEDRLASDPEAEIRYFSVDLEAPEQARIKVYLGCSRSAEAVDRLIEPARNSDPNDAERWLDTLTASQGPFEARPILNCFSFRRDVSAPDVTVHVPIRCYVKHDAEALARVAQLLTATDADRLSRALRAVSDRPLNVGRGLLTYASLRREASAVRVTVYLAPEAYSITSRRPSTPPPDGFASGVHKTAARDALAGAAHLGDVQAVVARQGELLGAQPLLGHLAGPASADQARRVTAHLSLLALWLGDLFRFAQERCTDPLISVQLAKQVHAQAERSQQFAAGLQTLGLSNAAPLLFSPEHALIRELAYARVADAISASHDSVRLGMVLAVSAISRQLLSAGLAFSVRAMNCHAAGLTSEADPIAAETEPQLWLIRMPEPAVADVYAAVDRCFESLLRVMTAIDRSTFAGNSSEAITEAVSLAATPEEAMAPGELELAKTREA